MADGSFGITPVCHFLFVPLTFGLAPLMAILQTAWGTHRKLCLGTAAPGFFGKKLVINFALGVEIPAPLEPRGN